MKLPERFLESIHDLLTLDGFPDETAAFASALEQPSVRGLRANRLRVKDRRTLNDVLSRSLDLTAPLEPVPWTPDGLYYDASYSPATLTAYHAGLFYIQEPSAMLPAQLLDTQPGEWVLDLCAAPGGKSCRIAADLQGEGLLWANDVSSDRIRPLIRNLELMGCANAVVSVETPERLAHAMPGWFDRVLVDAPCSGAGMLRRDNRALAGSDGSSPMDYVAVQSDILDHADHLLRPGGILVYSTCTFAMAENEGQIADFLNKHPDYTLRPIPAGPGLSPGLPVADLGRVGVRIWPHRTAGDGHFCAVLVKNAPSGLTRPIAKKGSNAPVSLSGLLEQPPEAYRQFILSTLTPAGQDRLERLSPWLRLHEGHLHGLPSPDIPARGLRLVKTGLYLGDIREPARRESRPMKKNFRATFTPSHALSHVLEPDDLNHTISYPMESIQAARFIRGETLTGTNQDEHIPSGAYVGIAADRYLLGFARQMPEGHLKNLYPPAWRKLS